MTDTSVSHQRRRLWQIAIIMAAVLLIGGVLVWRFIAGQQEVALEKAREAPVAALLRLERASDGGTIVVVDTAARQRNGIIVAAATAAGSTDSAPAYASVIDVAQLADLSAANANARTQVAAAAAKTAASRAAFQRATSLYKDEQIGSLAAAQAAEAVYRADAAASDAAANAVRVQAAIALQTWGPVLGRALVTGGPLVTRLLSRQSALVSVTLPATIVRAPAMVTAAVSDGGEVPLRLLSVATRADPRVQGASYYYLGLAAPGLVPGINLSVAAPATATGPRGAAVPADAIVLAGGRSWVYAEVSPGRFTRRPVEPDRSTGAASGGQRAPELPSGARIVVRGAQALLSEEFRGAVKVGEE